MAKVYARAGGRKLTKLIASHETVQTRLDEIALEAGMKAEAILRAHEDTGAAQISVEDGKIDRYVVLDDSRGLDAAMSIEYGRKIPGTSRRTTPVHALHDAFGLHGE